MLNISFGELLVFAIIALIILGPEKLPQTLRSATIKYRQLKNTMNKIQQDFENELELAELKRLMDVELNKIKANEEHLKAQLAQMQQEIDQLNEDVIAPEVKHNETSVSEQPEIKASETLARINLLKAAPVLLADTALTEDAALTEDESPKQSFSSDQLSLDQLSSSQSAQHPTLKYQTFEYLYSPILAVRIPYRDYAFSPLQYVRKVA